MTDAFSADDVLAFLDHAAERGIMPAATAQALAVATRNVVTVLTEDERADLGRHDLEAVVRRFNNRRAKDFSPSSLKEYGQRLQRAVKLFLRWRDDPANFSVKTRTTAAATRADARRAARPESSENVTGEEDEARTPAAATYQSAFPIRPGIVVTLSNVPQDLSAPEAERLAGFIRMLAIEG